MGILDKALKTVKNVGDSLAESAVNVGSSAGTSVQPDWIYQVKDQDAWEYCKKVKALRIWIIDRQHG